MKVPAATNYAVRALIELAATPDEPLSLHTIAARQQISHRFLEHIFRDLRAAGLVTSLRGGHGRGGYLLTVPAEDLTLAAVVTALRPATGTLSALASPDEAETSGHLGLDAVWQTLQQHIGDFLDGVTLADVVRHGSASGSTPAAGVTRPVAPAWGAGR